MDPILITGAARSGTSIVAGIVNICGAQGGVLSGPTKYNKKGMFENTAIRETLVKPFLLNLGCDPMGQKPLPETWQVKKFLDSGYNVNIFKNAFLEVFQKQNCDLDFSWFYKEAKMCLFWGLWKEIFPNAKWIIVRRNVEDIVLSCLRTGFMRAYTRRSGWLRWVAEHEIKFEEMIHNKMDVHEVWPQRIINGDMAEIHAVINYLGLHWVPTKVTNFVDQSLWRLGQNG